MIRCAIVLLVLALAAACNTATSVQGKASEDDARGHVRIGLPF